MAKYIKDPSEIQNAKKMPPSPRGANAPLAYEHNYSSVQKALFTTPPSTLRAAPVVADARGLTI